MSDIKKLLGARIKELRKQKNITQQQLAELVDVDQRNMSAIECGVNFPTKNFIRIAEALDVELKELFDFDHLELNDEYMLKESKKLLDSLDTHDLTIIYRLLKSMVL